MTGQTTKINKHFLNSASKKVRQYFFKRSVGIDISDRSIEVVEIKKDHGKLHVSTNRVLLEAGVVERGLILSKEQLKTKLLGALKAASPTEIEAQEVLFALPEAQVYTHFFSTAFINQENLSDIVAKEVELNIPLPFEDVIYSFKVIKNKAQKEKADKKEEIALVAVSRAVIKQWVEFFKELNLQVYFFEIEPAAHYSGLLSGKLEQPACIVDLGASITLISVSSKDDLFYTYSLPQGGDTLTQKIIDNAAAAGQSLAFEAADEIKRTQGLSADSGCAKAIQGFLAPIIEEIFLALNIGQVRAGQAINHVYLIGGTAALLGLEEYLTSKLRAKLPDIKVVLGQEVSIIEYVEALGLATRGMESGQAAKLILPVETPAKKEPEKVIKSSEIKSTVSVQRVEDDSEAKTKRQVKILIVLLIIGVFALGGSLWFKSQRQKAKKSVTPTVQPASFSYQHEVEVEVEVSVSTTTSRYTIKGQLLADVIETPALYEAAVRQSSLNVTQLVAGGHTLWPRPLKVYGAEENLIFPLRIEWLAYPVKQVNSAALDKVGQKMAEQKFLLNNTEVKNVNFDEKTGKAILTVTVSIMTNSK